VKEGTMNLTKAQQIALCYDQHVTGQNDWDWTQEHEVDLEEADMWSDHEQSAEDWYREYFGDWLPESVVRFLRNDGVADWREDRA